MATDQGEETIRIVDGLLRKTSNALTYWQSLEGACSEKDQDLKN